MKYNHALFLNPYIEKNASNNMMLFPPTGLEYVATSAKGLGGKVTLLDLRYENGLCDANNLLDFISKEIDIICVGIGWNRHFKQVLHLLNLLPDNIPLVVGGYKATEMVEEIFKSCSKVDIIVRGEGEETIKEILKSVPLESILGISYRTNGKVVHNGHRPLPNINNIASPDRTLRRNHYHLKLNDRQITKLTFDAVLSARGCPYKCKFCTFSLNPLGQKRNYSARSVESVIKEIEEVTADVIIFSDDDFFVNIKRAEEICDVIIERKIKKRFIAQARLEIAKHPTLLEKIVKAGFKILLIGIESPHDHILTQLNKGFDSDTIRKSFAVFKKYPIYYHGYFIYGNIGETEEEMLYIPKFAKEIGVDSITFQKLRIEQFSPLKEIVEKTPGYHISNKGILYSDTYSKNDLKRISKKIKFSFYTPFSFLAILRKCYVVRFFTLNEIVSFLLVSPFLLGTVIVKELNKGRLGDSLKHIFISSKQ
jgi:magnesium-protoporphyrin IX monomethyl ester (oxidative) cyclase